MMDPRGDLVNDRYRRQVRLPVIGDEGQRLLGASSVLVAGCGALGTASSMLLARAGVGRLVLADRDVVERVNLHRQLLYNDRDVDPPTPKAQAAAEALRAANPDVTCEAVVADLDRRNVQGLVDSVDLVVDGADNYELRFLLNEACVRAGKPFVSGAAIGTYGVQFTVLPGETACYACLVDEPPAAGTTATCETAGVLGSATAIVGAMQATEAIKLLAGSREAVRRTIESFDVWTGSRSTVAPKRLSEGDGCPVCVQGRYEWLDGDRGGAAVRMCGSDVVQVPASGTPVDLDRAASCLGSEALPIRTPYLLRFQAGPCEVTLFPDGRALVRGTSDPARARALLAETLGM